ncbi:hypothetical protein LCGC14_0836290 [marine sediment metagenome]|uniref:Uncharacterized protein n=1 Tax=marine sediment metagenome TaxID=412755 RepID=A0A0F9RZ55_9ZZZZ|nr:MAG: hypothetical protein Lokiarch_34740 [Candidatus Lokiarchaeum sp. GC14_75]HEC38414.1 hypothetical protein [bacterium]
MFLQTFDIDKYVPFITAAVLIGGGILLLKFGLAINRAENKTNMKWVAISFFIQYGVALFISLPILLEKITVRANQVYNPLLKYEGPNAPVAVLTITVAIFILINLINMIHKVGIKRSIVIISFLLGPMIGSIYLIYSYGI